jgi:hypothetical protein
MRQCDNRLLFPSPRGGRTMLNGDQERDLKK